MILTRLSMMEIVHKILLFMLFCEILAYCVISPNLCFCYLEIRDENKDPIQGNFV